jgi:hypothetical protein
MGNFRTAVAACLQRLTRRKCVTASTASNGSTTARTPTAKAVNGRQNCNATIGQYAEISLQDAADTWRHGAVFLLRNKPPMDAEVTLDGWITTVAKDLKAIITRGHSSSSSYDDTHSEALRAANNALDYMCIRGLCDGAIRDDSDDCLVWWPGRTAGITIRARVIYTTRATVTATGTVTDKAGNPVPPPPAAPITAAQHDAFRFIRMSRTSEYLFDSYRNMFLALERLLSDIRPRATHPNGRPAESERAWFTAALQQADALVAVAKLAPPREQDPIDWVYTNMYGAERSGLMHAKPGLYHLPQDDAGRADLRGSLRTLSDYVNELVGVHLNVQRSRSGLTASGWQLFARPFLENMALIVAEKELPVTTWDDKTVEMVRSNYVRSNYIVELPAAGRAVIEEPMLITGLGVVDGAYLQSLGEIRTIGVVGPLLGGELRVQSELLGPITLGTSVTRFEIVVGVRNLNMADLPNFSA